MPRMFNKVLALVIVSVLELTGAPVHAATKAATITFEADVWADNWFSLFINGKKVGEDSVPITTTKSFNKERITFSATYPFTIGVIAKDYVENISGLEYIGTDRQQIGDAGLILQIHEKTSGKYVIGTNENWKSFIIQKAPLNTECEKSLNPLQDCKYKKMSTPANWSTASFKDNKWESAHVYSEAEVGVKEGYLEVAWDSRAKLIWSQDLKLDNTVLFRKTVTKPETTAPALSFTLTGVGTDKSLLRDFTCDGAGKSPEITWNVSNFDVQYLSLFMTTTPGPPRNGEVASSKHYEWVLYNIPKSLSKIPYGSNVGTVGKNFQGRNSYAAPCSQGPGQKVYSITVYAHMTLLNSIDDSEKLEGEAKKISTTFSRQDFTYART